VTLRDTASFQRTEALNIRGKSAVSPKLTRLFVSVVVNESFETAEQALVLWSLSRPKESNITLQRPNDGSGGEVT
jgi:hypothetical protein